MQNLNLWRKVETANSSMENTVKFKSVKRETVPLKQRVLKKKVPVFKQTKSIDQKRSKKKQQLLNPQNAENELK